MLNENARLWVKALRSGEYKQGKHRLRIGEEYCCLGVACDLFQKAGGALTVRSGRFYTYNNESMVLPNTVQEWLGLTGRAGQYNKGYELSHDNDTGKSFAEIADIIESEPPGLFQE